MKIKWMTEADVRRAGAAGPYEAIKASVKHWRQLVSVRSAKELQQASCDKLVDVHFSHCALCSRYYHPHQKGSGEFGFCYSCPLRVSFGMCATLSEKNPWGMARTRFYQVLRDEADIAAFRDAARKMLHALLVVKSRWYDKHIRPKLKKPIVAGIWR